MNGVDVVELARTVAGHGKDIENLKGWQESQNGTMQRMDNRIERLEDKIDALKTWIMGTLVSVAISFLGLLLAIAVKLK